ncbi:MAG: hypothetical protein AAFQ68_06650, partial [Bacteroidota bacterium]
MDLHKILKARANKDYLQEIAVWVAEDEERFAEVWRLINSGEEPTASYASWLMDHTLLLKSELLLP